MKTFTHNNASQKREVLQMTISDIAKMAGVDVYKRQVLMVWSVLGGTGSASSSSMEYSTVVHYFESLQVTQFSLDLNTGVITMNLKEGGKNNLPLPDTTSQSTTQATGGLLSGMLSSSDEDTAAQKNSDGTVTVRYKLPYASKMCIRDSCWTLLSRTACSPVPTKQRCT